MNEPRIWAKVSTQFRALHRYPDAEGAEEFLKHPHHHVFHVEVMVEQFHDNRDVEYFALVSFLEDLITESPGKPPYDRWTMSCEQLARELLQRLLLKYGADRKYIVSVSEDGVNGAVLET